MAQFNTLGIEGDISLLAPVVSKWEGGYVNDPTDRGGATNMGITLTTWKHVGYDKNNDGLINATDIKLINKDDFKLVLRKYWDKWDADKIKNQSIANILVDWYWGSGKWGIVLPQRLLGLKEDGIAGPKTIAAVNAQNPKDFHAKLFAIRTQFLNNIVKNDPSQKKFIKGWLNRLNDFKYAS